jgi:small subunit ribosomal protein S7
MKSEDIPETGYPIMKEGSKVPRRGNVPKREILPDPLYNSVLVTKLVNSIMLDGKKNVSQKVVYGAFDIIKEKTGKDPLEVFTTALENIMPSLEVKGRALAAHLFRFPSKCAPNGARPSDCAGDSYAQNRRRENHERAPGGRAMDAANNSAMP